MPSSRLKCKPVEMYLIPWLAHMVCFSYQVWHQARQMWPSTIMLSSSPSLTSKQPKNRPEIIRLMLPYPKRNWECEMISAKKTTKLLKPSLIKLSIRLVKVCMPTLITRAAYRPSIRAQRQCFPQWRAALFTIRHWITMTPCKLERVPATYKIQKDKPLFP